MTEHKIREIKKKMEMIQKLSKAPSQYAIFFHFLVTGKTFTVKEIASELNMTSKATERAVAKLLKKRLIQRSQFREGSYTCDTKQILFGLLLVTKEHQERLDKQKI